VKTLGDLRVKVFGDVADASSILELQDKPFVKGFTTNPTLMSKAGVVDYEAFASQVLHHITDRPVSFEVLADDDDTIESQARLIASWAPNVYVKIPVTNTLREPMFDLIRKLSRDGIQVNVTAAMTLEHSRLGKGFRWRSIILRLRFRRAHCRHGSRSRPGNDRSSQYIAK
jgi:transaldolase